MNNIQALTANGYAVLDVETSGMDPQTDRILSIAAITVAADGAIEHTLHTLLNPEVDPGPTHIHGLTTEMLTGQPRYHEIAPALAGVLRGRTLVAHNVAFDYAFLAAEAHRSHTDLPVDSVLCTVELAKLLRLDVDRFRLADLAQHWGIPQTKAHDALDDTRVLTGILAHSLTRAEQLNIELPLRSPHTLKPPTFRAPARARNCHSAYALS